MAANGARTRSYSLNSLVGNPGSTLDQFNPDLIQYFKLTQISRASLTFTFLEEHPDTINDGFYVNRWQDYSWGNLPATHHYRASSLAFADGHIENHKWVIADTVRPPVKGGANGGNGIKASPVTDFEWMKERASVPKI
jgi:hypothetical protein